MFDFLSVKISEFGGFVLQEHIPIDEVFENLDCTTEGLSDEEVQKRLAMFGYNKFEEKKVNYPSHTRLSFFNFDSLYIL